MFRAIGQQRNFLTNRILQSKIGQTPVKFDSELLKFEIQPCAPPPNLPSCDRVAIVKSKDEELRLHIFPFVEMNVENRQNSSLIHVKVDNPRDKHQKAMWGTSRALLSRMVEGLGDGFTLPLRMVGVGYRALMENGKLSLKVGVSHPVLIDIPMGIKVTIPVP